MLLGIYSVRCGACGCAWILHLQVGEERVFLGRRRVHLVHEKALRLEFAGDSEYV